MLASKELETGWWLDPENDAASINMTKCPKKNGMIVTVDYQSVLFSFEESPRETFLSAQRCRCAAQPSACG